MSASIGTSSFTAFGGFGWNLIIHERRWIAWSRILEFDLATHFLNLKRLHLIQLIDSEHAHFFSSPKCTWYKNLPRVRINQVDGGQITFKNLVSLNKIWILVLLSRVSLHGTYFLWQYKAIWLESDPVCLAKSGLVCVSLDVPPYRIGILGWAIPLGRKRRLWKFWRNSVTDNRTRW